MGQPVLVLQTPDGLRAADGGGRPIQPGRVWQQLEDAFGSTLPAAMGAMAMLAASLSKETLADGDVPYQLYTRFRPNVPAGKQGFGAQGELDLGAVLALKDDVRRTLQTAEERERVAAAGVQPVSG